MDTRSHSWGCILSSLLRAGLALNTRVPQTPCEATRTTLIDHTVTIVGHPDYTVTLVSTITRRVFDSWQKLLATYRRETLSGRANVIYLRCVFPGRAQRRDGRDEDMWIGGDEVV